MTLSRTASPLRTPSEQTPALDLKRPLVVFDGGNRTLKWIDPDHRLCRKN